MSLNKVIMLGRLTKDPEIFATKDGGVMAKIILAVNRRFDKTASDFFYVVAFKKTAEFVEKYMKKGTQINVVGRLQTKSYVGKDGKKNYITEIIAEEVYFAGPKTQESEEMGTPDGDFFESAGKEELPFRNTRHCSAFLETLSLSNDSILVYSKNAFLTIYTAEKQALRSQRTFNRKENKNV